MVIWRIRCQSRARNRTSLLTGDHGVAATATDPVCSGVIIFEACCSQTPAVIVRHTPVSVVIATATVTKRPVTKGTVTEATVTKAIVTAGTVTKRTVTT